MKDSVISVLLSLIVIVAFIVCLQYGYPNSYASSLQSLHSLPASAKLFDRDEVTSTLYLPLILTVGGGEILEEVGSQGIFQIEGISLSAINPLTNTVMLKVLGANLTTDKTKILVMINDFSVSVDNFELFPNLIQFSGSLVSGRNDLAVVAEDDQGAVLSLRTTIWAGDNTLTVTVIEENNQPVDGANVLLALVDDQNIKLQQVSQNGQVIFQNIPKTTIIVEAKDSGNRYGSFGTTGDVSSVEVKVSPLLSPSLIDNNDFSLGTSGWVTNSASIELIPHVEGFDLRTINDDIDLVLNTSGEGAQSISRAFQVKSDTQSVKVRYKFVTSEVPGGYFGSEFNDYFSIVLRSQNSGGLTSETNSMNGLGLGAFDGGGATSWREVFIPVNQSGDTVQVDIVVANVADGLYDSQVLVDAVQEQKLDIRSDKKEACVNETVTFRPVNQPSETINWNGGGNPSSASGNEFATRFDSFGTKTVTAKTPSSNTAKAETKIKESSGAQWVSRFPTSQSVNDLASPFQGSVSSFIAALKSGGASISIAATYRPKERAYLMHYAWRIAKEGLDPVSVPAMNGVEICWLHRKEDGSPDVSASRSAAAAMVQAYQIVHKPSLTSRHTEKQAIDMSISWSGALQITNGSGDTVTISSTPRNGSNSELHTIGSTYGVYKLVSDPPHWSSDGH
jgi:hypothetical protein